MGSTSSLSGYWIHVPVLTCISIARGQYETVARSWYRVYRNDDKTGLGCLSNGDIGRSQGYLGCTGCTEAPAGLTVLVLDNGNDKDMVHVRCTGCAAPA